jgi:MerR family transcriptional regulator, redox-sensitive transcriptional activator SoxR
MSDLSIGDVAARVGVRTSALRYYESIGLLPAAERVNGRRRYDERSVRLLRVLLLAQKAGFTLAEMRTLVHGFDPDTPPATRWRILAQQKQAELDAQIAQAQQMKQILQNALQCGCVQLEDCEITLDGTGCATPPAPAEEV